MLLCYLFIIILTISRYNITSGLRERHAHQRVIQDNKLAAAMMLVKQPIESFTNECNFSSTMNLLQKHWLPHHSQYPLLLLSISPWDRKDKVSIRRNWNQFDIMFININEYFNITPNVIFEDYQQPLSELLYKQTIQFMLYGFTQVPLINKYRYIMRIDDSSCILDNINYDIFSEMYRNNIYYGFRSMYFDPPNLSNGITEFIENYMSMNIHSEWTNANLRDLRVNRLEFYNVIKKNYTLSFATNFEVIDIKRYTQSDIFNYITYVIKSNMIFHRRWSDGILKYFIAEMFLNSNEVYYFCDFDYKYINSKLFSMCDHRTFEDAVVKYWKQYFSSMPFGSN